MFMCNSMLPTTTIAYQILFNYLLGILRMDVSPLSDAFDDPTPTINEHTCLLGSAHCERAEIVSERLQSGTKLCQIFSRRPYLPPTRYHGIIINSKCANMCWAMDIDGTASYIWTIDKVSSTKYHRFHGYMSLPKKNGHMSPPFPLIKVHTSVTPNKRTAT